VVALAIAGALGFAAFAVAAPLAVYTVTLALFGLPHVLSELRYVDRRFGRRVGWPLLGLLAGLLAVIAAARAALVFHVMSAPVEVPLELGLVALLALSVARGSITQRAMALAVALAIGTAAALAPFDTAVTLAVLHNLTPLGLLWQLAPPERRWRVMTPAVLGMLALPLLVATGLPRMVLGPGLGGLDPLGAGPLGEHLFAYVPRALSASGHVVDLFTASVVAQGGHYLSVILVLPWLLGRFEPGARGVVPWPRGRWFLVLLLLASAAGLVAFGPDFAQGRAVYGIFASMHAWLEIPVLVLALTGLGQRSSSTPTRQDAVLAASETSMAR
jgi:hypothetical protein